MTKIDKTNFDKRINAKSGFADPARIKYQRPEDKPKDGKNSPWDFRCPQYDQRSSNFVNAGTHYGVGIKQPVGHEGNPKSKVDVLPLGRVNTMRDDEEGWKKKNNLKASKNAHTANTKYGMGDFYGTGVKQKIGIVRQDYLNSPYAKSKNIGKPPKSLA